MTNTKFRKRALLSSVAMMLVALIALGSATFAWYLANPTVTASGLKMQTQTSPGLAVASASARAAATAASSANVLYAYQSSTKLDVMSATWDNGSKTYTFTENDYDTTASGEVRDLQPVSFDTKAALAAKATVDPADASTAFEWSDIVFGKINAAESSASAKGAGAFTGVNVTAAAGTHAIVNNVYIEDIYLRISNNSNDGAVDVGSIQVDIADPATATLPAGGIRVAIVSVEGGTIKYIGTWAPASAQADENDTDDFQCYDSASATAGAVDDATFFTSGDVYSESGNAILTVGPSETANYLRAYVYLDGEDYNVYSDAVNQLAYLTDGITITVTKL